MKKCYLFSTDKLIFLTIGLKEINLIKLKKNQTNIIQENKFGFLDINDNGKIKRNSTPMIVRY
jgi:hypothetical protein